MIGSTDSAGSTVCVFSFDQLHSVCVASDAVLTGADTTPEQLAQLLRASSDKDDPYAFFAASLVQRSVTRFVPNPHALVVHSKVANGWGLMGGAKEGGGK